MVTATNDLSMNEIDLSNGHYNQPCVVAGWVTTGLVVLALTYPKVGRVAAAVLIEQAPTAPKVGGTVSGCEKGPEATV